MNQPVNRPRRIEYLDLFRAMAIMAVVAIHATSTAVTHYPTHSQGYDFYFSGTVYCNLRCLRFCFVLACFILQL